MLSEEWKKRLRIETKSEEENIKAAVTSSLLSFKSKKVDQILQELQKKIKDTEKNAEINELMEELQKYKAASREINAQLGRVVTK